MCSLYVRGWLGMVFLAAAMCLVLLVPAGTVDYWQAWVYLVTYFAASLMITLYLMKRNPALLAHRLRAGPTAEKKRSQKIIMLLASIGFLATLLVPSLDHRFGWSSVPILLVITGDVLTAGCFVIFLLVFRENAFSSATIEIVEGQTVVSTGPYALVRHPMYAGGLLLFIGTPLALGSYWGLAAFFIVLPALIWRLLDEEKFLAENLPGYPDYCAKVRWRLIPGLF